MRSKRIVPTLLCGEAFPINSERRPGLAILIALLLVVPSSFAAAPESTDPWIEKGDALLKHRDIGAAIAAYTEAIRLDPTSAKAYSQRGWAHAEKADYDAAITDYSEAIDLTPTRSRTTMLETNFTSYCITQGPHRSRLRMSLHRTPVPLYQSPQHWYWCLQV